MFWELGPFDTVLDVGGNVGAFANASNIAWPAARIVSFEPLVGAASVNEHTSGGRWHVERVALSSRNGTATMRRCVEWSEASTLEQPGPARARIFGARDTWEELEVATRTLDDYLDAGELELDGRVLLKLDVEGHELEVMRGARETLERVDVVVCEVNQCELVAGGAPPASVLDDELRRRGLYFAGVAAARMSPDGSRVVQFDGVWSR